MTSASFEEQNSTINVTLSKAWGSDVEVHGQVRKFDGNTSHWVVTRSPKPEEVYNTPHLCRKETIILLRSRVFFFEVLRVQRSLTSYDSLRILKVKIQFYSEMVAQVSA